MPEIEDGVPIPPLRKPYAEATSYPLVDLEVGQSFLIECPEEEISLVRNRITASISYLRKKDTAKRFTVGKVEGGVRCWRIE